MTAVPERQDVDTEVVAPLGVKAGPTRADRVRQVVPVLVLVVMYAVTVAIAPGYLKAPQIGSLLQLASILGVAAVGQTLVILIGGIDLSVGAVVTMTNLIAAAIIANRDASLPLALVVVLGIGALVGLANGLLIQYIKVPDLVATLATMTIVVGVGLLFTHGSPKGHSSPALNALVTQRFLGVLTGSVVIWVGVAAVVILFLRSTAGGRYVYAVGLNREASRYAAVPVSRTVALLYVASGLTSALAGFLLTGYTGSAYLASGDTYQMQTIAAVILGGTSMFGGRGGYGGTIIGVLITVLLVSALRVVGIVQAGQNIAYGVILLGMLVLLTRMARRSA
jgi:ribose transport system permease protein